MHRNLGIDIEAKADLVVSNLEHRDFEQELEAVSATDHNRFLVFSRQDQHKRTSVFMVWFLHSVPLHDSPGTLQASRKTCTTVPVVNAWTTVPVAASTSATASRTSTPVIRLISCRSESAELLNSWR